MPSMDHIGINITHVDAMRTFYTEVLGFSVDRAVMFDKGMLEYLTLRANESLIIDFFPPDIWRDKYTSAPNARLNHFCFAYDSHEWSALQSRLEKKGMWDEAALSDKRGARGDARAMYIKDPEGNTVEIRTYPE